MAIIIKKTSNQIHPQQAVNLKSDLPREGNNFNDARYVKSEHTFYIYGNLGWQELDLVIE
jgi:hypothetical protein